MSSPRVWLITGASSGFGRAMTERVLQSGDIAAATLRNPAALSDLSSAYPSSQLLVLKLDVTDPAEITSAFHEVQKSFGRLDVVFNNAGIGALAQIEATPDEVAKGLPDVNYWGAVHVSTEAVRFFHEVNKPGIGGKLLQVSSMVGINSIGRLGHYSATKFALEGLSQALAAELKPEWNIQINLIEPGYFSTHGVDAMKIVPDHPAYATESPQPLFAPGTPAGDTTQAAKVLHEIATLDRLPLRIPLGKDALHLVRLQLDSLKADLDERSGGRRISFCDL